MKFRVLLPSPKRGSRLTETVGVRAKQMVFNRAIQSKLKIPFAGEAYIGLAVNEDGFLCVTVLKDNAAGTAFRLTKPKPGGGTRFANPGKEILARLQKGRFAISAQEEGWWITDCRYDDIREDLHLSEPAVPKARKNKAVRTPPEGGDGLDHENDKRDYHG